MNLYTGLFLYFIGKFFFIFSITHRKRSKCKYIFYLMFSNDFVVQVQCTYRSLCCFLSNMPLMYSSFTNLNRQFFRINKNRFTFLTFFCYQQVKGVGTKIKDRYMLHTQEVYDPILGFQGTSV